MIYLLSNPVHSRSTIEPFNSWQEAMMQILHGHGVEILGEKARPELKIIRPIATVCLHLMMGMPLENAGQLVDQGIFNIDEGDNPE